MTPAKQCDHIIAKASEECFAILEHEVKRALARSPRYSAFAASMGTVCFYDRAGMPVCDEDLTYAAKRVCELGWTITEAFGSPGVHINKD